MLKKSICTLWIAGVLLLSACIGADQEGPADPAENEVTITASFRQEDGLALCGSTVRFSVEERHTDYFLDDNGELRASGWPRAGDLHLAVLDPQERVQGGMTLSFSEGAVIDATTDEGGVGHIMLRKDTDEVKLVFVLKNDGSLLCSLELIQPDLNRYDLAPQEANARGR